MSGTHLAIIVPAYNEESRIEPTLTRMNEFLSAQSYSWKVVVLSDGSSDRTVEIVKEFAATHSSFEVVDCQPNHGKGHVVRKGMLESSAELVLFSDADLATPIEEVDKLLAKMESHDIAIGSRPLKDSELEVRQPWYRETLGRAFNFAVQSLAVKGIQDTQCGFKLFRNKAAKDVFSRCKLDGFGFDFEALMIAHDLGYRVAEVPVRWRHIDGSKVVLMRDGPRMLWDLVKLRVAGKSKRLKARAKA